MVSLDDVLAAREAAAGRLHRTPLFRSQTLGAVAGADVHLKAELFQKTGSFKPRGVLANLAALTPEQRAGGVISISAGNHAQALAWGAAAAGIDALLVMWQGASEAKIAATRGYGATVDLESRDPTVGVRCRRGPIASRAASMSSSPITGSRSACTRGPSRPRAG